MNITIIGCPIVREKDGLAMSSRNSLLSPEQRKAAPLIYATLKTLNEKYLKCEVSQMSVFFKKQVEQHCLKVEYFFVASINDLIPVSKLEFNKKVKPGKCIIPFKYKWKTHDNCYKTPKGDICATTVSKRGTLKTYGYCYKKNRTKKKALQNNTNKTTRNKPVSYTHLTMPTILLV